MQVSEGLMNGRSVTLLRDTRCSTVVVRRSLVRDDQLIGKRHVFKLLVLSDILQLKKVEVETLFYTGQITAVCIENPLYDVITGNIANVNDNCFYSATNR